MISANKMMASTRMYRNPWAQKNQYLFARDFKSIHYVKFAWNILASEDICYWLQ